MAKYNHLLLYKYLIKFKELLKKLIQIINLIKQYDSYFINQNKN